MLRKRPSDRQIGERGEAVSETQLFASIRRRGAVVQPEGGSAPGGGRGGEGGERREERRGDEVVVGGQLREKNMVGGFACSLGAARERGAGELERRKRSNQPMQLRTLAWDGGEVPLRSCQHPPSPPDPFRGTRDRLELVRSMGQAEELERLEKAESLEAEKEKLAPHLDEAVRMYRENDVDGRAFTMKNARAILVSIFAVNPKQSLKKEGLLDELRSQAQKNPSLIAEYQPATVSTTTPPQPAQNSDDTAKLTGLLDSAVQMHRSDSVNGRAFTKDHARAILILLFSVNASKGAKKKDLVDDLRKESQGRPNVIAEYGAMPAPTLAPASSVAAVPPAILPVPALPTPVKAADTESKKTSPAQQPSSNVKWLVERCSEAVVTMESPLAPQDLALLVFDVVQKIGENGKQLSDDLSNYFFNAFDRSVGKKRDIGFIMDLAERVPEMLDDDDFTADALIADVSC